MFRFSNVVGQSAIINRLKRSIKSNTLSHAYAFAGPSGIGKRMIAQAFSAALLCLNPFEQEACFKCDSCLLIDKKTHPDFHYIAPGGDVIGVDDIREIRRKISTTPIFSTKKICLIEDADKMTVQSQNCILKTLEEPPDDTIVILTLSNYNALLDTVKSRLIVYNLSKNSEEDVSTVLKKRYPEFPGLDFASKYADGIIGKAVKFAQSEMLQKLREQTIQSCISFISGTADQVFYSYKFLKENSQNIDDILDIMVTFYKDLLTAKILGQEFNLINVDKKDTILDIVHEVDRDIIIKNLDCIEAAKRNIKTNINFQINIDAMFMGIMKGVKLWQQL